MVTSPGEKHTVVDYRDAVMNEREGHGIFQPLKMVYEHNLLACGVNRTEVSLVSDEKRG